MSKFFNVTLDKDVLLDDSVVSEGTGWSSAKTLKEIGNHTASRFESLDDVEVTNKQDKQVVVYSGDTHKFITVDMESVGEASGLSLKQLNKLGIVGTPTTPELIDIPISTVDFKVPKINILKFQLNGEQDVIKIQNSFTNGESNTFIEDDNITFDGTVHLETNYQYPMIYEGGIDIYSTFTTILDKSQFKTVDNMSIIDRGVDLSLVIKATPVDRLLIPKNDMNLSNVDNIDYFNLIAAGNLKIICSVDSGITWKTFNNYNQWENINLTIYDVRTKGIDVNKFNYISDIYWNTLINSNKVRFAYLLEDTTSIDELKMQYDGKGYWVEAKDTEYDVIYASNSLLQVKLYFSGDIKINY